MEQSFIERSDRFCSRIRYLHIFVYPVALLLFLKHPGIEFCFNAEVGFSFKGTDCIMDLLRFPVDVRVHLRVQGIMGHKPIEIALQHTA